MSINEIIEAGQVITDENRQIVQLDYSVWQEILTLLKHWSGEEIELEGWDALSDEALLNVEAALAENDAG